jgi:hypothetical protein
MRFGCNSSLARLALAALASAGCSLAFPLDDYDQGDGGGGPGPQSASSTSSSPTAGGAGVGGDGSGGAAPCGSGLYPPAATLIDTFDEGGEPNFFGCGQQVGGELRFDTPAFGHEYCDSNTSIPYCFISSGITVKVPEAVTAPIPGMQTWIVLRAADDSGEIRMLVEANGFGLSGTANEVPFNIELSPTSYDPFSAAWWHLFGENGEIGLATSPDGVEWTERGRGPSPLSLDGVFIGLHTNRYVNTSFPESADLPAETARFDCLNVTAGCP